MARDVRVPPGALAEMVEAADVSCGGRARFLSANME